MEAGVSCGVAGSRRSREGRLEGPEDAPKTRMFCEFDTVSAHAAPGPNAGSLYAVLGMNGAGEAGLGWK